MGTTRRQVTFAADLWKLEKTLSECQCLQIQFSGIVALPNLRTFGPKRGGFNEHIKNGGWNSMHIRLSSSFLNGGLRSADHLNRGGLGGTCIAGLVPYCRFSFALPRGAARCDFLSNIMALLQRLQ